MRKNPLAPIMYAVLVSSLLTILTLAFPAPAYGCHCNEVDVTIDCAMRVIGSGQGDGDRWRVVEVDSGKVMAAGSGNEASFSFAGQYDVRYKLQFGDKNKWDNSSPCDFFFSAGSVTVTKVWEDEGGNSVAGPSVAVKLLHADGTQVASGQTPTHFDNLCLGEYRLIEEMPPGAEPIGPSEYSFTVAEQELEFAFKFRNRPRELGRVSVIKVWQDEEGTLVTGGRSVTVRLYGADGSEVASGETPVSFEDLELGEYRLVEEVPAGTEPIGKTEHSFTVTREEQEFEFKFRNRPRELGRVSVIKVWQDAAGNRVTGGRSVTVRLYRSDGSEVDSGQTPVSFEDLELGEYRLVEEVPAGTEPIGKTEHSFTVTREELEFAFEFRNRSTLGQVSAIKVWQDAAGNQVTGGRSVTVRLYRSDGNEVDNGQTPVSFAGLELGEYRLVEEVPAGTEPIGPTEYSFTVAEEELEFAFEFRNRSPELGRVSVIKVWQDEDGTLVTGGSVTVRLYRSDGNEVDNGQTPVSFEDLELGEYRLVEEVPAGTEPIGPTEYSFTVAEEELEFAFEFRNRSTLGQVSAIKVWQDEDGTLVTGGRSVTVRLYGADGNEVASGETPVSFEDLELGEYRLVEEVPAGTEPIGKTEHSFTVTREELEFAFEFRNRPPELGRVSVIKVWQDEDGTLVTGGRSVTVRLYGADGNEVASGETPVSFEDLELGEYRLVEEVPAGTEPIGKTEHSFTVTREELEFAFEFRNRSTLGQVSAIKVWQDAAGNQVTGGRSVTVRLYGADGNDVASGQTPVSFAGLELGEYRLVEEVPAGTEPIGPTEYSFTLTEEELEFAFEFRNRSPELGRVSVIKVWQDEDGTLVTGGRSVTVRLYGADGNEVASGETPVSFEDLELGEYRLVEEVPAGTEPIGKTEHSFTVTREELEFAFEFRNRPPDDPPGRVSVTKVWVDEAGNSSADPKVEVKLFRGDGTLVDSGWTPVSFEDLELGEYRLVEEIPPGAEPIGPSEYSFTVAEEELEFAFEFRNRPPERGQVRATKVWEDEGGNETTDRSVTVKLYRSDDSLVGSGDTPVSFEDLELGEYRLVEEVPAGTEPVGPTEYSFTLDEGQLFYEFEFRNRPPTSPECECEVTTDPGDENHQYLKFFVDGVSIPGHALNTHNDYIKVKESNFGCALGNHLHCGGSSGEELFWPPGGYDMFVEFEVRLDSSAEYVSGPTCRLTLDKEEESHTTGQYQGFIGPVPFGTYTPLLEPGKEYFDMTQSVMYNVEYIDGTQGDIVDRLNGQEIDGVTTSIFNGGTFRQVESSNGRAVTTFSEGPTKLIAYRNGVEQARIFQTISSAYTRWIHPLDQPFEHKYEFELEIHGAPGVTDLLVYGQEQRDIDYDENGLASVTLAYHWPGLIGIYQSADSGGEIEWTTVNMVTFPITESQTVRYTFDETGLYHYRLLDPAGQAVTGPRPASTLEFKAEPGLYYQAQLAYPATSVFVGLYDDMKFNHPDYWIMPIDARAEHEFEFHLDYHRLNDPDLGNDHVRGEMVIDALYLLNATTAVAQQFPYGRHDGALMGVNLLGIPNVSMVAFCQRPGVHEMVFWGGWEAESYYLPERGIIFDEDMYEEWSDDGRGDCIDAARRVNMELARQGLRTDHTYRHHGEKSQGYQMVQQSVWSPYNLVGMRPPHIGQFLKPGTILPYYEAPEDALFWGWDLDNGGLIDSLGASEMQQYVASLGPVVYGDFTGIHPAEALNPPQQLPVPEFVMPTPAVPTVPPPAPVPPSPTPEPPPPTPVPPSPTPEPPPPTLVPPSPTPEPPPPAPVPPSPTPEPPPPAPVPPSPTPEPPPPASVPPSPTPSPPQTRRLDPGDQVAHHNGYIDRAPGDASADYRTVELSNLLDPTAPVIERSGNSGPANITWAGGSFLHHRPVGFRTVSQSESVLLSSSTDVDRLMQLTGENWIRTELG